MICKFIIKSYFMGKAAFYLYLVVLLLMELNMDQIINALSLDVTEEGKKYGISIVREEYLKVGAIVALLELIEKAIKSTKSIID